MFTVGLDTGQQTEAGKSVVATPELVLFLNNRQRPRPVLRDYKLDPFFVEVRLDAAKQDGLYLQVFSYWGEKVSACSGVKTGGCSIIRWRSWCPTY